MPMLYCNAVGSQTEIVFDGGSLVYDVNGCKIKEMKYFEEDYQVFDLEKLLTPASAPRAEESTTHSSFKENILAHANTAAGAPRGKVASPIAGGRENAGAYYYSAFDVGRDIDTLEYLVSEKNIDEIYHAIILGIRDYFEKMGFSKAVLGSSGGIDSAVTQVLAVAALGKENVRALLMPSQYSSSHSVEDAELLSKNLNNQYDIVPIRNIYDSFLQELRPIFKNEPFSIAEENIQSRTRGNLLMAVANKFGYILLNTSNKSELATGYGTLYGDMAGGLSVLGDVYKMQVYALANYINKHKEVIPASIITKAPSAELRPNQKDIDSLPEYEKLDRILYQYIELRQGPKEIIEMGYEKNLVNRISKLVNTNEYKRNQFCPIIRVSCKAFGVGRRVPIVGKYLS
jgi:NAD+ synthase (glutamine-hydrolysing)